MYPGLPPAEIAFSIHSKKFISLGPSPNSGRYFVWLHDSSSTSIEQQLALCNDLEKEYA